MAVVCLQNSMLILRVISDEKNFQGYRICVVGADEHITYRLSSYEQLPEGNSGGDQPKT